MAATLALVNGAVSLGLEVGSLVIPLIKGVITKIEAITSPQGTVSYTVVIATDQAELAGIAQVSIADLIAINAELKGQNAPQLVVPGNPPTP
jgi:hypothetical protein